MKILPDSTSACRTWAKTYFIYLCKQWKTIYSFKLIFFLQFWMSYFPCLICILTVWTNALYGRLMSDRNRWSITAVSWMNIKYLYFLNRTNRICWCCVGSWPRRECWKRTSVWAPRPPRSDQIPERQKVEPHEFFVCSCWSKVIMTGISNSLWA